MKVPETPAQELERYVREVRAQMKPKGKNELIRIISALLADNFRLKSMLPPQAPEVAEVLK